MRRARGRDGQKLVRFDEAFEVAGGPVPPACTGLIARLRSAIRASAKDRRGMVRHAASDHGIWVAWWDDEEFGAVLGQLINLSRSGAIRSAKVSVREGEVRLRLERKLRSRGDLELWAVEKEKSYFREVFGRELSAAA